jgi:DNA-binding NtrC family response regulator
MLTNTRFNHYERALVVEDDLWMQPLINLALRSALPGVVIDWVETAEEALRKTRFSKYTVILADINLRPNSSSGLDFWFCCREECPETPMLLMSSISVDEFAKKMTLYDPPYLSKPFNMTECKEVIKNLVSCQYLSS